MATDVPIVLTIITSMASYDRAGQQGRSQTNKKRGVVELSSTDVILAQNKLITQQIELLNKNFAPLMPQAQPPPQQVQAMAHTPPMICELCGGNHFFTQYLHSSTLQAEEVQYMQNQARQGNFQPFKPAFPNNNFGGWKNTQGQAQQ